MAMVADRRANPKRYRYYAHRLPLAVTPSLAAT